MQGIRVIDNVVEVDVGVDTAAHAANDCVFQPVELVDIVQPNGCAVVQSVVVIDYDDQGSALDFVFLSEPVPVGNNNATFAISDGNVDKVLGHVTVDTYLDLDQNQIGQETDQHPLLQANPSTPTSVWLTAQTTGTPTYARGELTIKVGVLRG